MSGEAVHPSASPSRGLGPCGQGFAALPHGPTSAAAIGYRVTRTAVAVVLLAAATLKLQALLQSGQGDASTSAWRRTGAALLLLVEWSMAVWMVSGVRPAWSRRAAMALLAAFCAVSFGQLFSGKADCGCLGAVRIYPAWTFALDLTLLVALYGLGRAAARHSSPGAGTARLNPPRFRGLVYACIAAATPPAWLLTGLLAAPPAAGPLVVLHEDDLRGKRLALLDDVDGPARQELASGRHTLVLVNGGCESCSQYLKQLKDSPPPGAGRIAVLDIAPAEPGQAADYGQAFQNIRLRQGVVYWASVPLKLSLVDGVVQDVGRPD